MEEYNPNAIWTSKKKKITYVPPEPARPSVAGDEKGLPPPQETSWPVKKIAIIFAVAVIVLGGAYAAWSFISRPVPAPSVSLDFAAPAEVTAGDPFVFSVLYTNSSLVDLKNASLTIALPANVFFSGDPESEQAKTFALGDIVAGYSGVVSTTLIAATNPSTVAQVSSTLAYTTDASHGASFSASESNGFAVGAPAVGLAISAPANVFAGQDLTATVAYKNVTDHALDNVKIAMDYPPGFTFTEASPTPAFPGNTVWNVGSVPAGAGGTILITGTVIGQNTALYSISGTASEDVSGESYTVAASAANVAITAAPLTIAAVLNNNPDYIAGLNDYLDYKITYANISNTTFQNVAIVATLTGAMFDFTAVQGDAAFNSRVNALTWYPANTPELTAVAPGGSGSVDFRVKTKSAFPVGSAAGKNFALGMHLAISSPTVPAGTAATGTSASADVTNKVGGVVAVNAVGYRYESGVKIVNTGPYPPVVNQPTTYTIHWLVTSYSTDVSNVILSANLESGTTCTGKIVSNISVVPTCNSATGAVTWNIPDVPAGTGVENAPYEAVFQVENMPAVNQLQQNITLLGKTSLTATDDFTGQSLHASANSVGTDIPEDKNATAASRVVTE